MNLLRHVFLFVLSAALALPAHAQTGPVQALGPLVGGIWEGDGQLPSLGQFRSARSHEFALGGRYLRVKQTISLADGRSIEEETFIGWDPDASRYTLWGFASDGSRSDATGEAVGENRFVFTGRTYGARASEWRMTLFIIDAGSMSVLLEVKVGRDFEPAMTLAYRRRTTGAQPTPPF